MKYIFRGIGLVFGNERFHKYLWRPLVFGFLLQFGLVVGAYFLILPLITHWTQAHGMSAYLGAVIATVLFAVFIWFFAATLFLVLAGMVSSWLWGPLSREVERTVCRDAPANYPSPFRDAPPRAVFSFVMSCCTVVAALFGVLPAIFFAGWLGLYDYTSSYYLRRRITFLGQFARVYDNRGWFGFALGAGALTLVPILNVILLPGLVAGGTLMCADSEASRR